MCCGGLVYDRQPNFFPYVKFVELEHKSNRGLLHVYIYISIRKENDKLGKMPTSLKNSSPDSKAELSKKSIENVTS